VALNGRVTCEMLRKEVVGTYFKTLPRNLLLWSKDKTKSIRSEFSEASMKMTAFCNIRPCSFVEVDRRFRPHGATSQNVVILTETLPEKTVPWPRFKPGTFGIQSKVWTDNTDKFLLNPYKHYKCQVIILFRNSPITGSNDLSKHQWYLMRNHGAGVYIYGIQKINRPKEQSREPFSKQTHFNNPKLYIYIFNQANKQVFLAWLVLIIYW
jgi:hypothetical protein